MQTSRASLGLRTPKKPSPSAVSGSSWMSAPGAGSSQSAGLQEPARASGRWTATVPGRMPTALRSPRAPFAVLGVLLIIGAAVIWQAAHDLSFFFDEWDFITGRRGVSTDSLLGDHNGHLSLPPV